jgi:hypothetical protein
MWHAWKAQKSVGIFGGEISWENGGSHDDMKMDFYGNGL